MNVCTPAAHRLQQLDPEIAAAILDAVRFLAFKNRATGFTVATSDGPYRCLMARDRRSGKAVLVTVARGRKRHDRD